jgi:PAS domain-containing protein
VDRRLAGTPDPAAEECAMNRARALEQPSGTDLLDTAPVMFDLVSADGTLVYANAWQERSLGFPVGTLAGKRFDLIYPREARDVLLRLFDDGADAVAENRRLVVRRQDRLVLDVNASINGYRDPVHGQCLRVVKFPLDETLQRLRRLEQENEVLGSIVTTARDATYCVEFLEPVDLTAPEHEVVRQVFANKCVWRYCNEAMSRLYRLPLGDDLNRHDVREVFMRNPENEAFVRQLLANGFQVDGALSRDHRYDGVDVMIENDVRARIEDGYLIQFWGVVRDLAERQKRERELEMRASAALDLLGAIPNPLLVVDVNGRIEGGNAAIESAFGRSLDEVLGADVERIVRFATPAAELLHSLHESQGTRTLECSVSRADGQRQLCQVTMATVGNAVTTSRTVFTFHLPRRFEARSAEPRNRPEGEE